ncbi:MAG: ATP-binding cassette domain-containing protein, partial [Sphingobacterium sp.]
NTLSISFRVDELVMMGRYPHFSQQPSMMDYEIVHKALAETGMDSYSTRDYNTLSGGEQQRVQLARVMAQIYGQQNALLFLDEPTNGLDLLYQQNILQLARMMTGQGCTVVSILHDINFACQYADYILLLKQGKTIAFGTPNQVVTAENVLTAFQVSINQVEHKDYRYPLIFPALAPFPKNND